MRALLHLAPSAIRVVARNTLVELGNHFRVRNRARQDHDDGGEEGERRQRSRGTGDRGQQEVEEEDDQDEDDTPAGRRQVQEKDRAMGRLLRLTKVELLQPFEVFLRDHATDADFFMREAGTEHLIGRFQNANQLGDAFCACVDYCLGLQERTVVNRCRWHFHMIFFYHITRMINPEVTGRRWGLRMKKRTADFLADVYNSDERRIKETLMRMETWSKLGLKLWQLCEEFGVGCLFFLAHVLNPYL